MDVLAAMRVFVRVVERGSMSAAARDLGLGQPAVSERIDRLEAHLGVRLLHRNTRKITVTDAGLIFHESSINTLLSADDAVASVSDDKDLRGTIRIAAPHGLGEFVVPSILVRLRELHPDLNVELVLNDTFLDPITEGVDLSLRLGKPGMGGFVARHLGTVRRFIVAAPSYISAHGPVVKPEDLSIHPFIRVNGLFNNGRLSVICPDETTQVVPINVAIGVSHWGPMRALLVNGAGVGVMQEPACAADLASGNLQILLPDYLIPGFDLHALFPATRPIPRKTRAILSLLEEPVSSALR